MTSQSKLEFLYFNIKTFKLEFNKESFEKFMKLMAIKGTNSQERKLSNDRGVISINDYFIHGQLCITIIIGGKMFYNGFSIYNNGTCDHQLYLLDNYLNEIVSNGFEKSIYGEINSLLNELYCFAIEKYTNKQENTSKNEITSIETQQQILKPAVEQPNKDLNVQSVQSVQSVHAMQPMQTIEKPAEQPSIVYDLNKLYIKRTNTTVVQNNIKCFIPDEYRKMVALYGKARVIHCNKRCLDISGEIVTLILRKNKNKSVLRYARDSKTKLVLKIGIGQIFETEDPKNFEWRVLHTEENVKHIENAFIELNKWVEENKKNFTMKQIKDKEEKKRKIEEEKRKIEEERVKKEKEEKRKIEEERMKKEKEEKLLEVLKLEQFTELK